MGNYISSSCHYAGKIVLPDGRVQEIERSVTVAELMLEHPQNFVVEFKPSSSAKLLPLPADYSLDPDKVYLMAPMERGKANGISAQEAYRILFRDRSTMMKPTMKIPFLGNCMVGESEKEKELMNGDQNGQMEKVNMVEGFEEKAEILCRQYSSKGWKPSLVTIQEKNFEKKVPHWLF